MCGGGGGFPPAPDPLEEARAQILIEQERARIEETQRLAEIQRSTAQDETNKQNFLTSLDSATAGASLHGRNLIEQRGLPFEDFQSRLQDEITAVKSSVPFLDPNPGAFFSPSLADTVLGRARDQQRRDFTNQLNEFAAPGFAKTAFPDSADNGIIQAILGEQFTPASDQILRAFQRGNLNDTGFRTATDQLNVQRDTANARLQDIGGGVLTDFRNQLRDQASTGFDRASSFELGQSFDPNSIRDAIMSTTTDLQGRLGGAIRGALGGEQLFNIQDLIARGGVAQGPQNPGAGSPGIADALAARDKERQKPRGLGSQGVF